MPLDLPAQTGQLLLAVATAFATASIAANFVERAWLRRRSRPTVAARLGEPPIRVSPVDDRELQQVGISGSSTSSTRRLPTGRRRVAWATPGISDLRSLPGPVRGPRAATSDGHARRHGRPIGGSPNRVRRQPFTDAENGD